MPRLLCQNINLPNIFPTMLIFTEQLFVQSIIFLMSLHLNGANGKEFRGWTSMSKSRGQNSGSLSTKNNLKNGNGWPVKNQNNYLYNLHKSTIQMREESNEKNMGHLNLKQEGREKPEAGSGSGWHGEKGEEKPKPENEHGWGWGQTEADDKMDELWGTIGPLLFPIPFVLCLAPFLLPVIPLSWYLNVAGGTINLGGLAIPIPAVGAPFDGFTTTAAPVTSDP